MKQGIVKQLSTPTFMSSSCVLLVIVTCLMTAPVLAATSCQGTRLLWCSATEDMICGVLGCRVGRCAKKFINQALLGPSSLTEGCCAARYILEC